MVPHSENNVSTYGMVNISGSLNFDRYDHTFTTTIILSDLTPTSTVEISIDVLILDTYMTL